MVALYAYVYDSEVRSITFITTLAIGQTIEIKLSHTYSFYGFYVGKSTFVSVPKTHRKQWCFGLWPYFGGDLPAPHEMFINLVRIK